jgi:hypothetical protein
MPLESHVSSDPSGAPPVTLPPTQVPEVRPEVPVVGVLAAGAIAPIWLQRLSLFVLVLFCVYLGVLVTILPWWSSVWDRNAFIQSRPALAAVLHNGAVRGLISGFGLLDVWIGISEAIHYRDHRA